MTKGQLLSALLFVLLGPGSAARAAEHLLLIDKHDHPVTSTKFSHLRAACPGLYVGQVEGRDEKQIFDSNGKVIPIKLPEGFALNDFFTGDDKYWTTHTTLPSTSCFDVQKDGVHGIVDQSGEFIVAPEYSEINPIGSARYFLRLPTDASRRNLCRIFDAHTKRLSAKAFEPEGQGLYYAGEDLFSFIRTKAVPGNNSMEAGIHSGYCDIDGKVVIPPILGRAEKFVNGVAYVTTEVCRVTGETPEPGKPIEERNIFIDTSGKFVAQDIYPQSSFYSDGYAIAAQKENPKLFGLVDRNFHFVLSPKFESLQAIANGLYAVKESAAHWTAIDSSGKKIFDLPKGELIGDPSFETQYVDAIVVRLKEDGPKPEGYLDSNCLIDKTGKVLIPPGAFVCSARFGLVDASSGYYSERRERLLTTEGKLLIPPQKAYFDITEPNRIIKTVLTTKFEPQDWDKLNTSTSAKDERFVLLLKDHNLIGMSQPRLFSLIGKGDKLKSPYSGAPNTVQYTIRGGICGLMWEAVEVEIENNVVKRWRFVSQGHLGAWFTQDMIYKPDVNTWRQQLIPKNSSSAVR